MNEIQSSNLRIEDAIMRNVCDADWCFRGCDADHMYL